MKTLVLKSRGAVYVEFVIVFIPVFTLFLGSIQMALMYGANLVVRHAATTAARAAVVVLDDDPSKYDDQPRNNVEKQDNGGSSGGSDFLSSLQAIFGEGNSGGSDSSQESDSESELGGKRFTAIRQAANIPLLAVSPSVLDVVSFSASQQSSLRRAIGGSNFTRLAGAYAYNLGAVAVTFPTAPRATSYRTTFGPEDDITVRVTYIYNCAVPIVNRWMCDSWISLRAGSSVEGYMNVLNTISSGASWNEIQAALNEVQASNARIERQQGGVNEIMSGAANPNLLLLSLGGRFHILSADAQMPNHGATYDFQNGNGE